MKNRIWPGLAPGALALALGFPASGEPAAPAAPIEQQLAVYAERFLPFDPQTKITVEKSSQKALPLFQSWRIRRTGKYEKLKVDRVVQVSRDGKWFFGGESIVNPSPRPPRSEGDLDWIREKIASAYRTRARVSFSPEKDAAGWKALAITIETGFFPVRQQGYVSSDGAAFLLGTLWDFQADPREERRRRIDLSAQRAQGPADAPVTIVEYADMECGYCKYRGGHLDKLLAANEGVVRTRRHYKFYPLWAAHPWAVKAASAGDCLFRLAGAALFRFKEAVYGMQEALTVSAIDELAINSAEALGVSRTDFLSCYLREESFDRIRRDIEEGYRLGVSSTPTYYVDGMEVFWVEDRVMEDFLRTKFPAVKSIAYAAK
jgi:protein-disulfide isomerase